VKFCSTKDIFLKNSFGNFFGSFFYSKIFESMECYGVPSGFTFQKLKGKGLEKVSL
jgi:hypothetical protein